MSQALPTLSELTRQFNQAKQWQDRFRLIIQLAAKLPTLDEQYKQSQWLVKGCENQLWLVYQQDEKQCFWFQGDSESRIIKGLLAIILIVINGKTAAEIQQLNFKAIFEQLQISQSLSESQQLGISRIIAQIQHDIAQA